MKRTTLIGVLMTSMAVAGCGNESTNDAEGSTKPISVDKPREPVELKIVPYWLVMSDEEYEELLFQPLKAKYPHITMKVDRTDPVKLAASGEFPDIYYVANVRYSTFKDLDIPYDMSPMVKNKANPIDLNSFSKPNIDWVVELGANGEVYGVPFDLNHLALFYNKDIFDKRGVPYPKDGMTWEDMIDLSRKLTFVDGGVQYRGFLPPAPNVLSGTKTMPVLDHATQKALINSSGFKSILELIKPFYEIPGIVVDNQYPIKGADFLNDQNVAMMTGWMTDVASKMQTNNIKINYDIVGVPSFQDLPGVTIHPGAKMMGISKTSKHKEDAYLAIQFFTSPEVQQKMNRKGRLTVLADESIRQQFGADVEVLKGKNVAGALKVKPAKMIPPHKYNSLVDSKLNAVVADLAKGTKDINTLLREAEETANKEIEQAESVRKK
ncbi:ABC transporter substrate-binding protein [Paenibacillus oceani]|uniref:Extracellular solute-binding protein n=1 Tax=Paenibacillus oceani TaxID=2772510 RepID=A0A927H3H2_9BACL|nr:extracellular solute-binding protein [Paenibacillus oceani]MBD2865489.1 extracellular solute-binding protein [Paenibacillus oceani]